VLCAFMYSHIQMSSLIPFTHPMACYPDEQRVHAQEGVYQADALHVPYGQSGTGSTTAVYQPKTSGSEIVTGRIGGCHTCVREIYAYICKHTHN